ncbi:MAG: CHAP domain-containing protein [Actinomycetia bacterium]|nr:CHAP domain-containing protein [Actinomycetes bacterium]
MPLPHDPAVRARRAGLSLVMALALTLTGCGVWPTHAGTTTPRFPGASFPPGVPTDATTGTAAHIVPFPAVDPTGLDASHQALLTVLQQEYWAQPRGTKYSGGIDEPWCADFVSWVLHEAGFVLRNPNSGSWRIPGIFTLQEYFASVDAWHAPDGHVPVFGDVVIYGDASTIWGEHTQIVLSADGGDLVTLGGNQPGGITVTSYPLDTPGLGLLGFGVPHPA